jgi:hypothetical protein
LQGAEHAAFRALSIFRRHYRGLRKVDNRVTGEQFGIAFALVGREAVKTPALRIE